MTRAIDDPDIDEVHEVRTEISARFGHDLAKLVAYYMELERNEPNQERFRSLPESKIGKIAEVANGTA